jgi:hypothetical protein
VEKFVSCFECGFDYSDVKEERCPKCGEEKIFIPKIHDPNFDIMKDPMELLRLGRSVRRSFSAFLLQP